MSETAREHICEPVYVTEGEVVCFVCGAMYAYHGTYDHDALRDCSEIVEARNSWFVDLNGNALAAAPVSDGREDGR